MKPGLELLERDGLREYVVLNVHGEKVKIEKALKDEEENMRKLEKQKVLRLDSLRTFIWFKSNSDVPMAVYRLMLYFGPPQGFGITGFCTVFRMRYKGHFFVVYDNFYSRSLDIELVYSIPMQEYSEELMEKKRKELKPVLEEFKEILEFLMNYPIEEKFEW